MIEFFSGNNGHGGGGGLGELLVGGEGRGDTINYRFWCRHQWQRGRRRIILPEGYLC